MIDTDAGIKLTINKNSAKWMQLPRDVLVGHGVLEEVGDVCRDLNLHGNALIVTGNTTWNVAGKKVCDILQRMDINTETVITCKATTEEVESVIEKVLDAEANFLLGIGSGRSIDLAKLASTRLELPFISIPTAASHDGIASSHASILDHGKNTSIKAQAPIAVIADTEIVGDMRAFWWSLAKTNVIVTDRIARDTPMSHSGYARVFAAASTSWEKALEKAGGH
jgi:glycerol-1-phosphate dehydrogenase [NAD(P)+]